ncbi:MAG TPA: PilZ domain-containing protein, partial [Planctomycetota bacterium]|nr:PilZ domain-containing protein [Planctomycetota bacterium]
MQAERRAQVRVVPEDGYFLRCTSPSATGTPLNLSTRLTDISPAGAGLQTLAPLRPTARLDLSIILPGTMARFQARGIIRWSASREFGSTRSAVHYAGVRFEAVEETPGRATDWLGGAGGRPSGDPQRRHARFRPSVLEAFLVPRTWARRLG